MSIPQLVTLLQQASDAYYNGTGTLLGDDQYDGIREELERRDPSNPFLRSVGAPVQKGAVKVPYKMASLNKIKPGTGSVESFVASSTVKRWVLSDKLDGISVLWIPSKKKLYLRGDGLMGVDVSPFAPYLHGLYPRGYKGSHVLRGELVLPNDVPVEGTLSRSWVNGQLHQKTPIPEQLGKIHFVAYELLHPSGISRSEQFQQMEELGFEVPWHMSTSQLNDASLSALFKERRAASAYGIDGIVIGEDSAPLKDEGDDVTNPKDMRAFKMPLDDQRATTQVVDVIWSASYQGYWIPRIQIQPVMIGGSRIEFLTGHNARMIVQNKIAKGSTIIIRKSGDVIPTLEKVLVASPGPIALPEGEWDGDSQTASHYKVKSTGSVAEMTNKKLEHFAKTLDIPHLGPGLVAKLVAEGKDSVLDLVIIEREDLEICVGKGMAAKIYPAIQERLATASEMDFMVASGEMPRGVGGTKLKVLFEMNPDPRTWHTLQGAAGWSKDALLSFVQSLPTYEAWRKRELPMIPYPRLATAAPIVAKPAKVERFCFTGFRDAEAEKLLASKGHEVGATLSGKTTILIVASQAVLDKGSEKLTKARELKTVRILTRDQMKAEYL